MNTIWDQGSFLRPRDHLRRFANLYPRAWRQVDLLREIRKDQGGWPDWCFLPLAGAAAIVSGGRDLPPGEWVQHVGTLALWLPGV